MERYFFLNIVEANHFDKIANQTPLFYAAREGHLEMCKMLIEAGCDISHQDSSHKMAGHYAKRYGKN
jgi:ankyrin repeat protein